VDISAEPFDLPASPFPPAPAGGAVPAPDVVGQPCPMCGELIKGASLVRAELRVLSPCGCAI
jgi:hypothetical protein